MKPVSALMLCAGLSSASAQEIVLLDPVRVAFYEVAPASLATSMGRAVESFCEVQTSKKAKPSSWLCSDVSLRYFRGVDVLGNKQRTGLVCASSSVTQNLKYYTEDMFAEESDCTWLSYSVESEAHEVVVND